MTNTSVELIAPVAEWAERIRTSLARSVEAIVATGNVLLEAKAALPHGQWLDALAAAGTSPRVAQMFMSVAQHPTISDASTHSYLPASYSTLYQLARVEPEGRLVAALEAGEVTPSTSLSEARMMAKGHGLQVSETLAMPDGVYSTIVMDPPWRFEVAGAGARGSSDGHYPTMSVEEIADLDLPSASDAHLYMWCPTQFLVPAHEIVEGYGFTVRSVLAWVKPNSLGLGRYFRGGWEPCLFATRGSLELQVKDQPAWFEAERTKHSAKPANFVTDVVERCSPGPYLELFARRPVPRPGWTYWGNEV